MPSTISTQAWEVPNSKFIITLEKMHEIKWVGHPNPVKKDEYFSEVGMSLKTYETIGYTFFRTRGLDEFNAFENLLGKIDQSVEFIFKMSDWCDSVKPFDIPVKKMLSWEQFPKRDGDFVMDCVSSLSRTLKLMEDKKVEDPTTILCRNEFGGNTWYYGQVMIGDEIVFKAKPAFDRKEVVGNIKLAYLGSAALLERVQDKAWFIMTANASDAKYNVTTHKGRRLLENIEEE